MGKHELFKSFIGSHMDLEKDEELKGTRAEIESKVEKIITALKEDDDEGKEALVNLIEDFRNHYESVYLRYDRLTEDLRNKANEDDTSSDSDDSPKKKNGKVKNKLELALLDVDDLKRKLGGSLEEKEILQLEYQNKIQEAEQIIVELNSENSRLEEEIIREREGGVLLIEKDKLQSEKDGLRMELETVKGEVTILRDSHKEEMKKTLELAEDQIAKLCQVHKDAQVENVHLSLKISQLEDLISELNAKLGDKEQCVRDLELELKQKNEQHEMESLNQINDLKEQINSVQLEAESLLGQKLETEKEIEKIREQVSEFLIQIQSLKQELTNKNSELNRNIKENLTLEQKIHEITETFKQEVENKTLEQHKTLEEKQNLVLQVNTLTNQSQELEQQLRTKIEDLQQEKVKMLYDSSEMDRSLIEKENELKKIVDSEREANARIKALTAEVNSLEEQLGLLVAQKSEADIVLEKNIGEISGFVMKIEMLKEQVSDAEKIFEEKENLAAQIKDLQLELKNEISSKLQLSEEKSCLESKISELEKILIERGDEVVAINEKTENVKNEASIEIGGLKKQIEILKSQLEMEINTSKKESEKKLKEKENEIVKLETKFQECEESLEKKMEEMSEQLEAKSEEVKEMEKKIEEVTREVEMKREEMSSVSENMRNIEVKHRLNSQKLRVTEQTLSEKDEIYLRKEEKLVEEKKRMEEKAYMLSGIISVYKEAQKKLVLEVSEKVNSCLDGIDAFHVKYEEDYGHLESRIYEIVNEVKVTRKEIADLVQKEKDKEFLLEIKIGELENQTKRLIQTEEKMGELKMGFLTLSEEKREAIRQLSVFIEYHRTRYHDLKHMVAKLTRPLAAA